jgi:hypothetical protein
MTSVFRSVGSFVKSGLGICGDMVAQNCGLEPGALCGCGGFGGARPVGKVAAVVQRLGVWWVDRNCLLPGQVRKPQPDRCSGSELTSSERSLW